MPETTNGWFQRHVTEALERIEKKQEEHSRALEQLSQRVVLVEERQRMKAAVYGFLGGLVGPLAVLVYWLAEHV